MQIIFICFPLLHFQNNRQRTLEMLVEFCELTGYIKNVKAP